ncbi:9007_t:CDS:2 [Funneliformis mosseae]|uniref:9007_t:CDS:1 n=1 Tax=Funneliformis mosseae TaxID=27381 RepID=A0A9N9B414_FUNMO|nr:9007_t:CDS:2 [Funneliformis mosseae]
MLNYLMELSRAVNSANNNFVEDVIDESQIILKALLDNINISDIVKV